MNTNGQGKTETWLKRLPPHIFRCTYLTLNSKLFTSFNSYLIFFYNICGCVEKKFPSYPIFSPSPFLPKPTISLINPGLEQNCFGGIKKFQIHNTGLYNWHWAFLVRSNHLEIVCLSLSALSRWFFLFNSSITMAVMFLIFSKILPELKTTFEIGVIDPNDKKVILFKRYLSGLKYIYRL